MLKKFPNTYDRSIKVKMVTNTTTILVVSFVVTLSIVAYQSFLSARDNAHYVRHSIQESLIAKGNTLVANNSLALAPLASDLAFMTIQELVAGTVSDDTDIIYGMFTDTDLIPWVNAHEDNPTGVVTAPAPLSDLRSIEVNQLTELDYRLLNSTGFPLYEFAAPVIEDGEVLGHIRYGLSAKRMMQIMASAEVVAKEKYRIRMAALSVLSVLIILFVFMATVSLTRRLSNPIESLKRSADRITAGDYDTPISVVTNDEIGVLSNQFEHMRSNINKKISVLERINKIGERLAQLQSRDEVYSEVIKRIARFGGFRHARLVLLNSDEVLDFTIAQNNDLDRGSVGFKPPLKGDTKSLAWHAQTIQDYFQEQDITLYCDACYEADESDNVEIKQPSTLGKAAGERVNMVVPLLDDTVLTGFLFFGGGPGDLIFENTDYTFIKSIARLLVITINNIDLVKVVHEQNRTLEQKVVQRTAQLQEKTDDIACLLTHMDQGLFTILPDLSIHAEYAVFLESIFETQDIAGQDAIAFLFENSVLTENVISQVESALLTMIGEDAFMHQVNGHLLLGEYVKHFPEGRSKILELDWNVILTAGEIDRIMVTVRDVTRVRALQAEADNQKLELSMIGEILAIEPSVFHSLCERALGMVGACADWFKGGITPTDSDESQRQPDNFDAQHEMLDSVFRDLHTIKGNARMHNLTRIVEAAHSAEQTFDQYRKQPDCFMDADDALAKIRAVERTISHYLRIANEQLGRVCATGGEKTASADPKLMLALNEKLNTLCDKVTDRELTGIVAKTAELLQAFDATRLDKLIQNNIPATVSMAEELGKTPPEIVFKETTFFIKNEFADLLQDALVHLIRNALDHGIETPAERREKRKSTRGSIRISARPSDTGLRISVSDDGKGLALGALQKRVENTVLKWSDTEAITDLVFAAGFSTKQEVTTLSGRGVGLDVVKSNLQACGGEVRLSLERGEDQDTVRPFCIEINLPKNAFISA